MRSGKLRHYITLQKQCETRSESGASQKVWGDIKTVWASVDPVTGKEPFIADTDKTLISVKITTRHDPDLEYLTGKCRILWQRNTGDVVYDVEAVLPQMYQGTSIIFLCSKYDDHD